MLVKILPWLSLCRTHSCGNALLALFLRERCSLYTRSLAEVLYVHARSGWDGLLIHLQAELPQSNPKLPYSLYHHPVIADVIYQLAAECGVVALFNTRTTLAEDAAE